MKIKILGLGAGEMSQMTMGVYRELKLARQLFLRTKEHPVVPELEKEGLIYSSFDDCYEKYENFEEVYQEIVKRLLAAAQAQQEIHYAVPGHPMVAERTVQLLLQEAANGSLEVELVGGQSFIDPMLGRLQVDPVEGFLLLDATSLRHSQLQPQCHTIITQVYDEFIASEVKLTLMEVYPDDTIITVATAVGIHHLEQILHIPLYELDRVATLSNLTAVYIPRNQEDQVINRRYERTREIFRQLRGPNGCPWDKKQTHQSLKKYVLEEANEVVAAIDEEDIDHLVEELGDLLLQVFLHAQIGEDEGMFTMEDVLQTLNEKMIRRHPHVFGDVIVENAEEVVANWNKIKRAEKEQKAQEDQKDSIESKK